VEIGKKGLNTSNGGKLALAGDVNWRLRTNNGLRYMISIRICLIG
jgi:hypothetical protein